MRSSAHTPCRIATLGMISALGVGTDRAQLLERACSGDRSHMRPITTPISKRATMIGEAARDLCAVPDRLAVYESRNARLVYAAYLQIECEVRNAVERYSSERVGVVIGSSTSGIAATEESLLALRRNGIRPPGYSYTPQEMGSTAELVAAAAQVGGVRYTISTACSSSAKVFQAGRSLLESGMCDAVIVGGSDSLCAMTLEGFGALELLAAEGTNPFSKNRAGINVGEAATWVLLTRDAGGVQLLGCGEASDAHHISAPEPSGRGALSAMRAALDDSGLGPEAIHYLNLHGTGTPANDRMESLAVHAAFPKGVACSSTKPLVGHTLGASGGLEIGLCWLALDAYLTTSELRLPRHCFDGEFDPELPALDLVTAPRVVRPSGRALCMSNSFGFGGSNCSVVLGGESGGAA
ncbi:MAG: beta-ketoacyl-ACP synthase [Deltaproteobacteria bacterium]|nr:beta-ketoacyl-ACP synthase [Deltaproteobacteria bacterium]